MRIKCISALSENSGTIPLRETSQKWNLIQLDLVPHKLLIENHVRNTT